MKLVIISGRSGSGKSIALHVLEDLGYFAIDNLPIGLLSQLPANLPGSNSLVAVSIDARNIVTDPQGIQPHFEKLKADGYDAQIIYLDSDDGTLIDRFNATRRKHPLSSEKVSLAEALVQEANLLEQIAEQSDLRVDTSNLSIYDLREIITQQLESSSAKKNVAIQFQSFGFKRGIPKDCDFVFDVRCLPNPYWEAHLRGYTGQDQPVIDFLEQDFSVRAMISDIASFLDKWLPSIIASSRSYITVGIGCTGGQHRSVFVAEQMATKFKHQHPQTLVRHRDLSLANKD
ncbi:RNase adapter RapZ [Oceanospirillum sanctuarii]|uniref:RNase adapter RapZ n=1 Tax=Oceanospirillum sanctuarii TaxID=1434821 RepID=UPI000A368879|nr:RNase adapter RapZ [Oceanospirillum sanctuarii]